MSTFRESVVEKDIGGYRLPDKAIDLQAWLRDGLEVYNLFVFMKPLFFQMLEAQGGEFRGSSKKSADDALNYRVSIREEDVGKPGDEGYDRLIIATLTKATGKTEDFAPIEPLTVGGES